MTFFSNWWKPRRQLGDQAHRRKIAETEREFKEARSEDEKEKILAAIRDALDLARNDLHNAVSKKDKDTARAWVDDLLELLHRKWEIDAKQERITVELGREVSRTQSQSDTKEMSAPQGPNEVQSTDVRPEINAALGAQSQAGPENGGENPEVEKSLGAAGNLEANGKLEGDVAKVDAGPNEAKPPALDTPPSGAIKVDAQKPATWDNKAPASPWCPEEIKPHLSFASTFEYQDELSWESGPWKDWKIIAATRRGKLHAHHGTHREDAFQSVFGGDFIVACVCDGAGSCKYSRVGSETACREITQRLKDRIEAEESRLKALDDQGIANVLAEMINLSVWETCKFLQDLAAKSGCESKDFRCTLLLVLLRRGISSDLILSCHVGDGFIAGLNKKGIATRYGVSDSGDFSGEVGCFVPDGAAPQKAADSIMSIKASDVEALIVCSDGIEDPFYPVEKKASNILQQLYEGVQAPLEGFTSQPLHGPVVGAENARERLGLWLGFEKKGENDDRTILVLHRHPKSIDDSAIKSI